MSGNGSGRAPRERTAIATVAADASGGTIAFGAADEWRLLVTHGGRPLARLRLPDPGAGAGAATFDALVLAACDDARRRVLLAESLRRRMGCSPPVHRRRSVSVAVCTRARLDTLAALLQALEKLDPRPDEVVVVDNAPAPGQDCRALAESAAAVYVREDAPGLNNARRAAVAASQGELIAFTDDDCLPPPGWLRALPELFSDENVGAVTGPAFPLRLDTPSRRRFEEVSSFSRGLAHRDFDWTVLAPAEATRAGAGANMVLRRALLEEVGEAFPPELDVGTPTRSGGDMYALYKVLASGRRVAYDPRVFTYHLHRSDPEALHRAIHGYGVGLSAVATKLLVEEREPAALKVWAWLVRQYAHSVARGLVGRAEPTDVRIAWDYLRGALAGPVALRTAQKAAPPPSPPAGSSPVRAAPVASTPPSVSAPPAVSVVVITNRPAAVAQRCVAALAGQDATAPPFEVVLVDDSRDGRAGGVVAPAGVRMRRVSTAGAGAAIARNSGAEAAAADVLLFLDDDLIPAPGLVGCHLRRHGELGADAVVVGYSPPRPVRSTLAARAAALWWEDHFRAKREMVAATFVDVLSGNMSVRRDLFERAGPFDPSFGACRREDWEWGIRVLGAGARLHYEAEAVAEHRFDLDARGRIAAARAEGRGDALLVERHPRARAALPFARSSPPRRARGRILFRLLRYEHVRDCAVGALDALERLKARTTWARWFDLTQRAAYEQGLREGGARARAEPGAAPVAAVELDSDAPLPRPEVVAPALDVTVRGVTAMPALVPAEGQWTASLAEQLANSVPGRHLERVERLRRVGRAGGARLDDATVLLGPAATRSDRHAARWLAQGGVDVRVVAGARRDHWAALDRAVREAERPIVALPLPGVAPQPVWLEEVLTAFEGERVAAVTGAGLAPGLRGHPLLLSPRERRSDPYPAIGLPSQYLVVRRQAHLALGGFDAGLGHLGHHAPLLEFLERARAGGWLVGRRNTPGLAPTFDDGRERRRAEWQRWRARGGLIARDARTRGTRWLIGFGALPVAVRLWRAARPWRPGWRHALGTAAAMVSGMTRGARRG